jgi:hypothetical protein
MKIYLVRNDEVLRFAGIIGLGAIALYACLGVQPAIAQTRELVAQSQAENPDVLIAQGVTRVTRVELNQTDKGLEVILKTSAGGQRLVPLILPEGNKLVIDLLDATLAFGIRNGLTKPKPAPGIKTVKLAKVDENSIRLTITGPVARLTNVLPPCPSL